MFKKIKSKLLFSFLLVSLVPLLLLGGYAFITIQKDLTDSSIEKVQGDADNLAKNIENELQGIQDDLFLLRDSPSLNFDDPGAAEEYRKRLAEEFLNLSKHRKKYYQIRFIDANGMEYVRVDRRNGKSFVVPPHKLQNKKDRYYFTDTAKLKNGKMFISKLDLNREGGEIEQPLRPVIRYGTPVYDKDMQFKGIVILNVDADNFLKHLKEHAHEKTAVLFTDNDGFYYVNTEDPTKEWGGPKDLNTGFNFKKDNPEDGAKAVASWTPMVLDHHDHIAGASPVFLDNNKKIKLGNIIHIIGKEEVLAAANNFRNIMLGLAGVVFLVTLLLAILMANSITKPIIYLTQATTNMSKGKLSDPITVTSKDETKDLSEALDKLRRSMVILLKRRQK